MDIATYVFFSWMMATNFIIMGGAVFGLKIQLPRRKR